MLHLVTCNLHFPWNPFIITLSKWSCVFRWVSSVIQGSSHSVELIVVFLFSYFLRCDKSIRTISQHFTQHRWQALQWNEHLELQASWVIKNNQIHKKITNSSLSALCLPVVFILIAIGQQSLLLALHNWLRWEITKQKQIALFVLCSTCSWAQANKEGHPCTRISVLFFTDVSISRKCCVSRFSDPWLGVFKRNRGFLLWWMSECTWEQICNLEAFENFRCTEECRGRIRKTCVFKVFYILVRRKAIQTEGWKQMQKENDFVFILELCCWKQRKWGIMKAPKQWRIKVCYFPLK